MRHFLTTSLCVVLLGALPNAQDNQCVTCHFRNVSPGGLAEERHLDDWDTSAHAAADVGCEACHRGDPEATNLIDAHRDILSAGNPASPVYIKNIPETCGACHLGPLDEFATSRHDQLLFGGDLRAPTCMTCHGAVGARLPSTRGISSKCATCHGPEGAAPISDHHELVRQMRDRIQEHRYSLALVRTVVEHTSDPERRSMLSARHDDANALLGDAVAAWHAFSFDRALEPLEQASERIQALIDEISVR